MGFHISWLAVRGKSATDVLAELSLEGSDESGLYPESDVDGIELPTGWYMVHFNRPEPPELSDSVLARLSQQVEVVSCVVEEGAMVSLASCFINGTKKWSVEHDADQGLRHLDAVGSLPSEYEHIREHLLAELNADPNPCDYLFDVPAELVKGITGYRHDQVREDEESNLFMKLVRIPKPTAKQPPVIAPPSPQPVIKPWWKVW